VTSVGLARALCDRAVLEPAEAEQWLQREQSESRPLAELLVAAGRVNPRQLAEARARAAGVPFVDLATQRVPAETVAALPLEFVRARRALPLQVTDAEAFVAVVDPADVAVVDDAERLLGRPVRPVVAVATDLDAAIAAIGPTAPPQPDPLAAAVPQPDPLAAAAASFAAPVPPPDAVVSAPLPSPAVTASASADPPADEPRGAELHINELLERVLAYKASDLHLTVGTQPQVRVHGELVPLDEFPVLDGQVLRRMIYAILTQKQRERLESELELDVSYTLPGRSRFRVNVFMQRNAFGAVLRTIPTEIVPLESLGLPSVVRSFAEYPRGLVLVTGPTGSGKSTTLASLIDIINREQPVHIMTVEDPIEFVHDHKRAIVNQREVGEDTKSFSAALRHVLRQDPDVILVGELRDLETIQTALTAAETGHLVFATLHTQDAPQSIDRLIDVFPPHQQQQVRVQLATSVQAIVTQQLVRSADGNERFVAAEVMVATPAIRNLIREGKIYQIYSSMQAGGQFGMQTMDQALSELVKGNKIPYELAVERCSNESDLARLCGRL
jgi:twitching motility protein PilT